MVKACSCSTQSDSTMTYDQRSPNSWWILLWQERHRDIRLLSLWHINIGTAAFIIIMVQFSSPARVLRFTRRSFIPDWRIARDSLAIGTVSSDCSALRHLRFRTEEQPREERFTALP